MFERFFKLKTSREFKADFLQIGSKSVPVMMVRHPKARRYLMRLRPDGIVRLTIPRQGTISAARDFASRNIEWLEKQLNLLAAQPKFPNSWNVGTEILFRGGLVQIEKNSDRSIRFGAEQLDVPADISDLRPVIQKHLQKLAEQELSSRVAELAAIHEIEVFRVTVRNQKTRWGSCSKRGTISLNWRLIQAPFFVRDYIILHELAHRRQMNHSSRFWREVEQLCPDYLTAEKWLRQNARLLR